MKIIVSKNIGFCSGVLSSINKSMELLKVNKNIYCYGELVHNQNVNDKLKKEGLILIDNLNKINDDKKVIIRAHGIPKEDYEIIKKKNLSYFDFTCPKVLAIHKLVQKLVKDNYYIILIAHKNHPEAIGTISFCEKNSIIIDEIEDIKNIYINNCEKVAIVSQTTYSIERFNILVNNIKDLLKNHKIKVFNTICSATYERQEEVKEIAHNVDRMIIIGGKNSSNTHKLYEIALQENKNCILVQDKKNLMKYFSTLKNCKKIGISTGTSTSNEDANEIIEYLNNL